MIRLKDLPNPLPRKLEVEVAMSLVSSEVMGAYIRVSDYIPADDSESRLISKAKVTFEIGDVDIPGIQIESLKKQKQQILAEAHVKAEQIEQQIQSLLAIEYHPETDGAA